MMLVLRVEVDATYDQCEEVLSQIEELREEHVLFELGAGVTAELKGYVEIDERRSQRVMLP